MDENLLQIIFFAILFTFGFVLTCEPRIGLAGRISASIMAAASMILALVGVVRYLG